MNKSAHFCAGVHVSKSYSRYTDVNVFALGVGSRYVKFTVPLRVTKTVLESLVSREQNNRISTDSARKFAP